MGTKLEAACADLDRIASALKTEKVSQLDEGRKERKQRRNQDRLYGGLDNPLNQVPAGGPKKSKKSKAASAAKPKTPIKVVKTTVSASPPAAPPIQATKVKVVSDTRRPAPASTPSKKPTLFSRTLGKLPDFMAGKKPPQDKNEPPRPDRLAGVKDRLKRLKGMLKGFAGALSGRKRLTDDVYVSDTFMALYLGEERSSTTFKKCPKGAMVSTAHLRHSLPKNMFVNPDEDNPTYPIRPGCRSSLAALGRAIQPDMANSDEAIVKQVIQRVNQMGGTRGKTRLRLWGTGKGGKRMETFRGPPGTPKRTGKSKKLKKQFGKKASKLHGVSTGKPDNQKHTPPYSPPGGSKGPAGNREVPRHPDAHKKPPGKKKSKGSQKRRAAQQAGTIKRGKAKIGR